MLLRLALLLPLVMLASCGGPNLTKVTGTVKYKDKPVANATVVFQPDGGGTMGAATTDSSGKYAIGCSLGAGVPPGSYSVRIKSQAKPGGEASTNPMANLTPGTPEYQEAYMKLMQGGRDQKSYKPAADADAIPAKYDSGSELKALVDAAGTQEINFDLK